jgi:hypothetical protein
MKKLSTSRDASGQRLYKIKPLKMKPLKFNPLKINPFEY